MALTHGLTDLGGPARAVRTQFLKKKDSEENKMKRIWLVLVISLLAAVSYSAQTIRVHPTGVNVNSQNPTTVFLTFGQIPPGYLPAESLWCGALIPAPAPALGRQCRPDTIYGALPARYNRSGSSGNSGFTDIMAIPPAVVRRAYQAAQSGGDAGFFYVRRFTSTVPGQPDQFVAVTCRMSGGGARVPFSLSNVEIKTAADRPVLFIRPGEPFPEVRALIKYNGTGRLKGRWEIVRPGEEPPDERDLLTEATLPVEQRGTQKRYTEIARFNHFLPPVGEFELPLKPAGGSGRLPILAAGQYILLLRIEAVDDKEGGSNLQTLGVGNGIVSSGAVAAFPMPVLKFFITGRDAAADWTDTALLSPSGETPADAATPLVFSWKKLEKAAAYRLEVLDQTEGEVLSAVLLSPTASYRAPSWFWSSFGSRDLSWRVIALDENGRELGRTKIEKLAAPK